MLLIRLNPVIVEEAMELHEEWLKCADVRKHMYGTSRPFDTKDIPLKFRPWVSLYTDGYMTAEECIWQYINARLHP